MDSDSKKPLIGIVGPCGSGKSTLLASLATYGYHCRHIAQEHSYVKHMWQVITKPDILIFLECSFENCTKRRQLNWSLTNYQDQQNRLSHAHQHANLIIDTNSHTPNQVFEIAKKFLEKQNL